ncbi:MAG: LytR C-terminal domain-containing protein [Thermoleophilaceae bacterium]
MQIVQEIGSYAGLAAILGLAVLSALYFSQARDVKRLREWAGRAPERAPEPSWMAAQPSVRPVPRAPGQAAPPERPAAGAAAARPQFPPTPAGARTAATGAAPAAAVGPGAATPAAARAAETAQDREDDEQPAADNTANGEASDGTDDRPALSQDTVIHPPPPPLHDEEEEGDDLERPEDELGEDSTEFDAADDDYDEHEGWDETGDYPSAPEEHWEDTGDEPAVSAVPPVAPRRAAPSAPARSAGAASARDAPPPSSGILPPYSESRPGAVAATDRRSRGGLFSSRGRAAGVIALAVLLLVALALGATQLLGGGEDTAKKAPSQPAPAPAAPGKKTPDKAGGISPASVRVAVLNGTTVPGLAAQIADSVEKEGFKLGTVTNFNDQQRAESVVLYAPGAEREAAEVGRRLKIAQREPVDAESQGAAGDATVVIVTGQDKTQ